MPSAAVRRFCRNRAAVLGIAVVALVALVAVVAPLTGRLDPDAIDAAIVGSPLHPSLVHPFGTDAEGRDYFARAVFGGRIALAVGVSAMLVAIVLGTFYGALAGACGGVVDAVLMRIVDVLMSFPTLLFVLAVEAIANRFTIGMVVVVIGLFSWQIPARIVRALVQSLRCRAFVLAAEAAGAGTGRIVVRHLLPNVAGSVIVAATLAVGDNILLESGLSFLGLGVQIPGASWGSMLRRALEPDAQAAPWLAVIPGLLIFATVAGFTFAGEGLRDALDPRPAR